MKRLKEAIKLAENAKQEVKDFIGSGALRQACERAELSKNATDLLIAASEKGLHSVR